MNKNSNKKHNCKQTNKKRTVSYCLSLRDCLHALIVFFGCCGKNNFGLIIIIIAPALPTKQPTRMPSSMPSSMPSLMPSSMPSNKPTVNPTGNPTVNPTMKPTATPTVIPTGTPTEVPSNDPTLNPTVFPSTSTFLSTVDTTDSQTTTSPPYSTTTDTEGILTTPNDAPITTKGKLTSTSTSSSVSTTMSRGSTNTDAGLEVSTTVNKGGIQTGDNAGMGIESWMIIVGILAFVLICLICIIFGVCHYRKYKTYKRNKSSLPNTTLKTIASISQTTELDLENGNEDKTKNSIATAAATTAIGKKKYGEYVNGGKESKPNATLSMHDSNKSGSDIDDIYNKADPMAIKAAIEATTNVGIATPTLSNGDDAIGNTVITPSGDADIYNDDDETNAHGMEGINQAMDSLEGEQTTGITNVNNGDRDHGTNDGVGPDSVTGDKNVDDQNGKSNGYNGNNNNNNNVSIDKGGDDSSSEELYVSVAQSPNGDDGGGDNGQSPTNKFLINTKR